MRLFIIILTLLAISAPAAFAQVPGVSPAPEAAAAEPTPDAEIEQLIKIIENEQTRAVLVERLRQTEGSPEAQLPADAPPDLSIARQLAEYTRNVAEGASATFRAIGLTLSEVS
jgi:moderate conductance mechanosensitive channel